MMPVKVCCHFKDDVQAKDNTQTKDDVQAKDDMQINDDVQNKPRIAFVKNETTN